MAEHYYKCKIAGRITKCVEAARKIIDSRGDSVCLSCSAVEDSENESNDDSEGDIEISLLIEVSRCEKALLILAQLASVIGVKNIGFEIKQQIFG